MTSTSTDRRLSVNSGIAIKVPCKVATTANVTLSGEQTIDGVACTTNDRVLVKNQSTASENGIYTVDTGTWSRAIDFDGTYDCTQGTLVNVISGTVNANIMFGLTTANPVIGTSSLTFVSVFDTTNGNIYSQGVPTDIASAGTTDIGSINSCFLKVTGTNAITSFGTNYNGPRILRFEGALVLTYNATTLFLPGLGDITTAAGDTCVVVPKSTTSGTADGWVVVSYQRASANPLFIDNSTNTFRLTLSTGSPITTADITAATTIYCTPYKGNLISLYDGSNWVLRSSAEFSKALGTLTSGRPYDVFCYDNAGTPTLEFLAWSDDTTRATAIAVLSGVLVKSGDPTRRYLGSFYTTSTTTTEDSEAKRYLWNYYNRVSKSLFARDTTTTWSYTTNTWRQANAAATNKVELVCGFSEDLIDIHVQGITDNVSSSTGAAVGIGISSTSTNSARIYGGGTTGAISNYTGMLMAHYNKVQSVGRYFYAWLEISTATGTTRWLGGSSASPALYQSGIYGSWSC